jgi:hypothetical protein
MARGTALSTIVTMLRAEARKSTAVNVGVDSYDTLKQTIRRVQHQLWLAHYWPFLRVMPRVTLAAGQRYYDWPSDLSPERVEKVELFWSNQRSELTRGISVAEYSAYDSESDERSDPVLKWDIRRTSASAEQIEVWPIPASNGDKLWFTGLKPLRALVADSDVADLDDHLLALFGAVELLPEKAPDRQIKLAAANKLFSDLTQSYGATSRMAVMGAGDPHQTRRYGPVIHVSRN